MKLDEDLFETQMPRYGKFSAVINAHGLYSTEQFVLRLSPKNHALIDEITNDSFDPTKVNREQLKAYSTYLHETIHWWQHKGSTIGFLLSTCYPNQTHSNFEYIKEWCVRGAPEKSIKYSAANGERQGNKDKRQEAANVIVNNTMDIEFYKRWLLQPEKSKDIYNDIYFESQGHSFHIAYDCLLSNLAPLIDPDETILPDRKAWSEEFARLKDGQVLGYFYGSPLFKRSVGIVELFEGQACFNQMQFLARSEKV